MQIKTRGLFSPRMERHLQLGITVLVLVTSIYILLGFSPERWVDIPGRKAEMPLWRLSMALAYSALLFLALTLTIGPYRVLRKLSVPVNFMLRRDVALWAGGLALAHVSTSIWIHTDGWALWGLYLRQLPDAESLFPLRKDMFGFANMAGTAAALILIMLLFLSNNIALKWLKTKNWKNLQRFSYAAFFMIGLHGISYQIVENRLLALRVAFFLVVGCVGLLQVAGLVTRLKSHRCRL